jgi:hypothetical protein
MDWTAFGWQLAWAAGLIEVALLVLIPLHAARVNRYEFEQLMHFVHEQREKNRAQDKAA